MDCYEILGISPDATDKDINTAYRGLALKHHPDKTGAEDDAIEFQKINQAVEILRDSSRRKEHDKRFHRKSKTLSEEEKLFASPDYPGWKPNIVRRSEYNSRDRYMFSYSNSVHMKPHTEDSLEEIARCARIAREEVDEEIRRAAEVLAGEDARNTRRENSLASLRQNENRRSSLNPNVELFESQGSSGCYEGPDPVWWAGVIPEEEDHVGFEADEAEDEVNAEVDLEFNEFEVGSGADSGTGFNADVDVGANSFAGSNKSKKPNTERDTAAAEASPSWAAHSPSSRLISTAGGYMTASQGTWSDRNSSVYMMTGGRSPWYRPQSEFNAYSAKTADNEDSESIYYDMSDAKSQVESDHKENNENHGLSTDNEAFDTPSSKKMTATLFYENMLQFNNTNMLPYLAPFVPYFAAKLASGTHNGRYTQEDFYTELKGLIMEIYCGWLETVRVTFPGAGSLEPVGNPQDCFHLGYWMKEFGHEGCERCHLWRPMCTLVCPSCGLKRCIGCKF